MRAATPFQTPLSNREDHLCYQCLILRSETPDQETLRSFIFHLIRPHILHLSISSCLTNNLLRI